MPQARQRLVRADLSDAATTAMFVFPPPLSRDVVSGSIASVPPCPGEVCLPSQTRRHSGHPRSAIQCQQETTLCLFDHLVDASDQRGRNGQAERFHLLEVDRQLVFGRRLYQLVGGLHAPEEAIDIPVGSVAVVSGITPAYSPALACPGLTAPPAPAHPVGRNVEHPGSGIARSSGGTHGTSERHRCSRKDRRRRK
jgi:hypothetical protein